MNYFKLIAPGSLINGKRCKNCDRIFKLSGTYCKRNGHNTIREIPPPKKRKNVDYHFAELVVAVCLATDGIVEIEDIKNNVGKIICKNIDGYIIDLESRRALSVKKYILFANSIKHEFDIIKDVYLLGKSFKSYPELVQINNGLDTKSCKSDIMVSDVNGNWTGVSVKADKDSFLTNYSVEKILSNGAELSVIRKKFLIDSGFPNYDKNKRDIVNKLFYPGKDNIYWDKCIESIDKEHTNVKLEILNGLSSCMTTYPVFEVDGHKCINLQKELENLKPEDLILKRMEYPHKKAAKLWYNIIDGDKPLFKIEIRWKGNIHFSSPQFLTQNV